MNSIDSNISSRFSPYLTKSEDSKTHVPYFCLEAENPYYEQHKNRLIAKNTKRYYEKNPIRKKNGRPVIHKIKKVEDEEVENILSC